MSFGIHTRGGYDKNKNFSLIWRLQTLQENIARSSRRPMLYMCTPHLDSVFGELSTQEDVSQEDLEDDVDEVEKLAEEELERPCPVLSLL